MINTKRKPLIAIVVVALLVPAASASAATTQPVVSAPTALPKIQTKTLRVGATGANVTALQQLLGLVGIAVPVTGNYAAETTKAVKKFQFAAQIGVSGVASTTTIKALVLSARGPRSVDTSGGANVGSDPSVTKKLGKRLPVVLGMSGRDVRELQTYLRRAGDKRAPVPTGEFGPMTVAAVKRFEAKQKRPVDGVADAGDVYALRIEVGQDASPGSSGDPVAGDIPTSLVPGNRARVTKSGLAIAPENAPIAVQKVIAAGNRIAFKPYLWGGGHGKWEDSGYDCSGSVSYALRGAKLISSPEASYGFFGYGKAGKGEWITIYTNSGHMYMTVAGIRFDTSGRGNNGSRWQTEMRSSSSFKVRHPSGL
jgi:peptidoglycan hydrolase-like protein with peptidoglycan-binding domain